MRKPVSQVGPQSAKKSKAAGTRKNARKPELRRPSSFSSFRFLLLVCSQLLRFSFLLFPVHRVHAAHLCPSPPCTRLP